MSVDLEDYCAQHGIRRTTTQGYDPSANGQGENVIGFPKRKGRQLVTGARYPSCWWGTCILAAAYYSRCAAGLEQWPEIPYETRAMVVQDPPPRNAFAPRSLPAAVFGPSERVPGGMLIYQAGRVKEVRKLLVSDMLAEEITFVKAEIQNYDTPITPCELPTTADWSPEEIAQVVDTKSNTSGVFNG